MFWLMAEGARRAFPNHDPDHNAPREHDGEHEGEGERALGRATLLHDAEALARYLAARLAPNPGVALPESDVSVAPARLALEPGMDGELARQRHAAVLAPLYARDGEPWIIFTRRASDLRRHSGEISFPGGGHDATDATLAETALREAYEELALDPARVRLLGALPTAYLSVSDFVVTTYVGWLGEGLPPLTPARGEVAEVIEAPLAALDDPAIYHEEIWNRLGVAHTVVFYDYGAYRIWGLTGRLLQHLLSLLPPRE